MKKKLHKLLIIGLFSFFVLGNPTVLLATDNDNTDNAKHVLSQDAVRTRLKVESKVNFQDQKPKPVADLKNLVGILQADLNKNQNQPIEIKVSQKYSSKKTKPIKVMQLSFQSQDKTVGLKSTNQENQAPVLDGKFSTLLKLFLSDAKIFDTLFTTTELKFTKNTNNDLQGSPARKILITPKLDFFGIKNIVASLDKNNHMRAVEVRYKTDMMIYEFKSMPQKKAVSTPLKTKLVW